MSVSSVFEFRFAPETTEEGVRLTKQVGADMPQTAGYLRHEVIRDLADPGHLLVVTTWNNQSEAEATLNVYQDDPKIRRTAELMGVEPSGFVGDVVSAP